MEKLKVALRKRIQQLVADWPEIIGMHGNSSARSVWAFLRGLKSGVREPPPHGKPFHLAVASTLSGPLIWGRFVPADFIAPSCYLHKRAGSPVVLYRWQRTMPQCFHDEWE